MTCKQKMHWLPSEVPLHEDIRDWNERLTAEEKNLINQILKFFTQGDVDIAQAYLDNTFLNLNHLKLE
jgi:ribonucleoside-diphosphate reductase beta chain